MSDVINSDDRKLLRDISSGPFDLRFYRRIIVGLDDNFSVASQDGRHTVELLTQHQTGVVLEHVIHERATHAGSSSGWSQPLSKFRVDRIEHYSFISTTIELCDWLRWLHDE